jgi:hypothetical protein
VGNDDRGNPPDVACGPSARRSEANTGYPLAAVLVWPLAQVDTDRAAVATQTLALMGDDSVRDEPAPELEIDGDADSDRYDAGDHRGEKIPSC